MIPNDTINNMKNMIKKHTINPVLLKQKIDNNNTNTNTM